MPKKRLYVILLMVTALFLFSGCQNNRRVDTGGEMVKYGSEGAKKVGIVFGNPAPGSPALRNAITRGVKQASNNMDIEFKILNPKDMVNNQEAIRYFAENQYDMVIAEGDKIEKDLKVIASQYPDIRFTLFGGESNNLANVQSVFFKDNEGAFLAGVEAALLTQTGTVGFLGGSETAAHDLENGFAKGVQYINTITGKKIKVLTTYAGVTAAAVNDQERGKALATNLFWNNADVVFSAEGKLAVGAAQAGVENQKKIICADPQLMNANPWNVYGTIIEKQETVVYSIIANAVTGKTAGNGVSYGLSTGAVDFGMSQAVPQDISTRVASVKNLIKQGKVKTDAITIPKDLIVEVNQLPVDMYNTTNQKSINQNTINQNTINQNTINQNTINQNTINQNTTGQNNTNQDTANQITIKQNSINQASGNNPESNAQ